MIWKEEKEEKGDDAGGRESLRTTLEKERKRLRRAPDDRGRRPWGRGSRPERCSYT